MGWNVVKRITPRARGSFTVVILLTLFAGSARAQADTAGYHVHAATTIDENLFVTLNHWGTDFPNLDRTAVLLSNTAADVVVVAPLALYAYGRLEKDDHASLAGLGTTLSVGVSGLISFGIKELIRRPRPYHEILGSRTPSVLAGGYSFPSGHSTAAFALATSLSLYYPKWYVIGPSALWAVSVALSRPYLGVHYPSDIIIGAIIGTGTALVVYHFDHEWGNTLRKLLPSGTVPSNASFEVTPPGITSSPFQWGLSIPIQ